MGMPIGFTADDVISGQNVKNIEGYVVVNFEVASSYSFRDIKKKSFLDDCGDFCTHYRPILHRLTTIHNAVDRQTDDRQSDRNRSPML